MDPKPNRPQNRELFRQPLNELIDLKHPLVRLSTLIDWSRAEMLAAKHFKSHTGRPAASPRLIAGLLYLQHAFDLSDEAVVSGWTENPYWQMFTGETYFQTKPPIEASSLTRWRQRLGEAGVAELLSMTVDASLRCQAVKQNSLKTVIVDTTVMPKAIAYPTDSRLLERARKQLVKEAAALGLSLRQNYNRKCPQLALQAGRYAHARQYKRMHKTLSVLRCRVGRVWRDIDRQREKITGAARVKLDQLMHLTRRILDQKPKDKNKLYALHAPEVECIGKGKARTPYEFGVKVSVTTTLKEGLVVGMKSLPGNPYDGHTLEGALEQAKNLTGQPIHTAVVDRGYKGVEIPDVRILRSGQKREVLRAP